MRHQMTKMQILCMGVCLSVLFGVNSVKTMKLEGKCFGSGSYYADGSKIGELKKSEDFTSEISDTVHIIGIKCCDPESSSIQESLGPESLGMATSVNGLHSTNANWKCLPLLDGDQEPEDWTRDSFRDRSWPRAKEIPQDALADNSYAKLGNSKGIWLSTPTLYCPAGKSCRPECSLCRLNVAQDFHSNLTEGVIRYPGSDSPLEDSVYLASHDFVVDVMGYESAMLTLKPCNRNSGNLVQVFFSAGNNISSKIQLCQNFPSNSTECKTVATSLNATISCLYYTSFYVTFPLDGSLSVKILTLNTEDLLMNFSGWQTDKCDHITSVVMSQRHPVAKFSFYRSNVENRCLVTKDEVAQLEQCGDDYIDEQLCLSCGCCWQAFVTEFSADVPYNFRCFLSFANATRPLAECRRRSLAEIIGDVVFSANGTTAFSEDPVAFVVGLKNTFDGIKISVQFGDGSSLDSLTLNHTEMSPVWAGNETDDYHKATFIHRYDVFGEITAVLKITDSRKDPNNTEVVMASVNFTVEVPDLVILSSTPKVDLYEEVVFVLLTQNFSRKTTADVILDDNEARYNLSFDSGLTLPSWVPAMYEQFHSIIILPHFYSSAGKKEVTAKKVIHDKSSMLTHARLVAKTLVTVRSLNETFARASFLTLSEQPVAENELVQYAFSLPKIINNTKIHVDFGDNTSTIDFTMDDLSAIPDEVQLVQNVSQYTFLFQHAYTSPGTKQPVIRISLEDDQPNEVFERRTTTTVMPPVSDVSLFADVNVTDLYEDVTFVLSAGNVNRHTRVLIDFGDGVKYDNISLRRDVPLPLWFQKMQRTSGIEIEYWAIFTHAFSSPGLQVVTANITNILQPDLEAVTATVNISIGSIEETFQKLLESLTVQISEANYSETPVLVRMKSKKVLKDTVLTINYGDKSKAVHLNLTTAKDVPVIFNFSHVYNRTKDVPDILNFSHVYNRTKDVPNILNFSHVYNRTKDIPDIFNFSHVYNRTKDVPDILNFSSHVYNRPKMYQVEFSITSKDHSVQVNRTKNITLSAYGDCKPSESIRLLGHVVIITKTDDPIVAGDTVSFLVLTKHSLKNFHLMLSDGTADLNVSLKLDTKSRLPPSAKKFNSYFQAMAKHTFCDHGSFWLRFTLFSCKNASLENITKYMYTTVFSFKEFIGNPIIFPVQPSRALAHENVTFLVVLDNVKHAAIMKLNFGDQQLLNLSISARQTHFLKWMTEREFSGKFKTVVNHSYASEGNYEMTVQVLSRNSECVIEAVESKTLVNIVPLLSDTIDMSVESQSYQSLPVNEIITFDIYTRKGFPDYVTQLDFGPGSNASLEPEPEISLAHSYRKQSYQHKFLYPGLYTVAVNVAEEHQNRSKTAQAKRSRCVNVIAFDEAVGKVKIFAVDERNKKFLVGEGVQFVVLVKNSIHGMHVSVSYGDRSSQKDAITFQEWELSLPSWLLLYQKEQYHYGIANHVFTNAGTYRVTVNVAKDDLDFNASFAVVESLWVTIHPKTSLSIIVAGGGTDIFSAVKYTRRAQVLFSASIHDYNDGDLNISWNAHRLKSMATGTQDTEVIFIPPDVDTTKTSLSIPPFSLNFGTYIFQIQLSQKESRGGLSKAVGSNVTWITIVALPLQSVINMKKHYDGLISWAELDGGGSNDPNEDRSDYLIYEWHCSQGGNSYLPQTGDSLCNGSSRCVRSCTNLPPGNHQSCLGCNFYATCYNETLYDSRPCPAKSFWDDIKKRCSTNSATCICKEPVTGCFREMRRDMTGPTIKFTAHDFQFSRSQVDYFFDLVVVSRLGALGKSDAVKVSIVSHHFHDSLPPPPLLSIICKSNCNKQLQQHYPLILTFQCLHCQLSEDDTLSPSWKVTGNFTMAKADLNWKSEVIYHQEHFIIKPSAFSKITPGNEYLVTLKVTGPGRSISATYKFSVGQNATLEYQQLDKKGR